MRLQPLRPCTSVPSPILEGIQTVEAGATQVQQQRATTISRAALSRRPHQRLGAVAVLRVSKRGWLCFHRLIIGQRRDNFLAFPRVAPAENEERR